MWDTHSRSICVEMHLNGCLVNHCTSLALVVILNLHIWEWALCLSLLLASGGMTDLDALVGLWHLVVGQCYRCHKASLWKEFELSFHLAIKLRVRVDR